MIAIDGTNIKANASMDQNRDYRQIAAEILREAKETDRREDEPAGGGFSLSMSARVTSLAR